MRGISHKELLKIDPWQYDNQQDLLNHIIEQCKQLNPWLPIDKNVPKNRDLLLFIPGHGQIVGIYSKRSYRVAPTHYQELPDDPKTGGKS